MSWLTDLVAKKSTFPNLSHTETSDKNQLYISVDSVRVCFLIVNENVEPNKIVERQEIFLGPTEDLHPGQPVRDMFGSLLKIFSAHKEKFENIKSVSVSIPAEGVFFKNVEVPSINSADIQKLIVAEIKKTLPVDFSQVLFAQNDLGEKHPNSKTFFCVGIQKNLFEGFKNLFAKFSLDPYFEIEVFSLARIVEADDMPKLVLQVGRLNTFLIFLQGQIIQDVKLLDFGHNEINQNMIKNLDLSFEQTEDLKEGLDKLKEKNRLGSKIVDEYVKEFNQKLAKAATLHILEYEKKQDVEIQEILILGNELLFKIRKIFQDEFDAELKVDFISEENFKEFVAENFTLNELKRYTQCFGLALRNK